MQLLLCPYPQREVIRKWRRGGKGQWRSGPWDFSFSIERLQSKGRKRWSLVVGVVGIFMLKFFSAVVTPRQAWLMKATFKTWCSKEELFERKMWNETWLYIGLCWWHSCGVLIPQVFFSLQAKIIHLKCVTTKEWPSTLYIFALLRAKQGSDHLLSSRWVRLSYIVVCLLAAFCHKIYRYDDYAPGSITTTRECYNGTR